MSISPPRLLSHPLYRADIDGLRCIAVLSVVVFHAAPEWMQGGFIGVDIFFVISGFLISSIIFGNLENDSFSLREFYARRIKRIFPALLVVLMATFAMGWCILLPDELAQLGKHLSAGALFISNLALWTEAGYFDTAAETKPLLHLWSLGIEEQFYILWPALLMLAYKWRSNILTLIVTFVVVSFALNIHDVTRDSTAAFYSPQTRFWELLCGSFLAWVTLHPHPAIATFRGMLDRGLHRILFSTQPNGDGKILTNILAMIGACLLVFGFLIVRAEMGFPGKLAIIPVLGAMLIIMAGPGAWFNRAVLSNRVAVWIGLISFPMYLWHWPLLSFARIMEGRLPRLDIRLAAVVLTFLLAWLTYLLIERPIRFSKNNRSTVIWLCLLMAVCGILGCVTYMQKGFGFRLDSNINSILLKDTFEPKNTRLSDGSCQRLLNLDIGEGAVCLTNTDRPEVLIIGDSHAMSLNSAAFLGEVPMDSLLVGNHGCLPLMGYSIREGTLDRGCNALAHTVLNVLSRYPSIGTIVIATRGPLYFSGEGYGIEGRSPYSIVALNGSAADQATMFHEGYSAFVKLLINQQKDVVFVIDPPELGKNPRDCFSNRPVTITEKLLSDCSQEKSKVALRQEKYRELIEKIYYENPQMKIYDPIKIFCDEARCYGQRAGRMLYWDDDHISVWASKMVLEDMRNRGFLP